MTTEFNGFGRFARHLARISLEGEAVTHELAEKGAKLIQRDAQEKLGHYQEAAGTFNEWSDLADSTKADRVHKGFPENEPLLRTGQLRESIEAVVHGNEAMVGSVDPIALWQERGTEHIPPRPFLGAAAFESKPKVAIISANTLIAWVSGLRWRKPLQRIASEPSEE